MEPKGEQSGEQWNDPEFLARLLEYSREIAKEERQRRQAPSQPTAEHLERFRPAGEITPQSIRADYEARPLQRRRRLAVVEIGSAPIAPLDQLNLKKISELAGKVNSAMWELEEKYKIYDQEDYDVYLLQTALFTVAALATPVRQPDFLARHLVNNEFARRGSDFKRRQSMRLAEGLKILVAAYDGFHHSDSAEDNKTRWEKFKKEFPSPLFEHEENGEGLEKLREGIKSSYALLRELAGSHADSHDDLIRIIDQMIEVFLHEGAEISDPNNERAIRNLLVLGRHDWPERSWPE